MLSILGSDELSCIVKCVSPDDLLAFALVCKPLSVQCITVAEADRKLGKPRWVTAATSSRARIKWAVEDLGATPTVEWCICAAANGHLATLQWLHSQGCPWDEDRKSVV